LKTITHSEYQMTNNQSLITDNDYGSWNWNYHLSIA
jgi:hypothetical protein